MFNIFKPVFSSALDNHRIWKLFGFLVMMGRLPDGDVFFRLTRSAMDRKIPALWGHQQMDKAIRDWASAQPTVQLEIALREFFKLLDYAKEQRTFGNIDAWVFGEFRDEIFEVSGIIDNVLVSRYQDQNEASLAS